MIFLKKTIKHQYHPAYRILPLLALLVVMTERSWGQTRDTLILQPDPVAGKDAPMKNKSQDADTNYGDYSLLRSSAWTEGGVARTWHTLIDVPVYQTLLSTDTIYQVQAVFYYASTAENGGDYGDNASRVSVITEAWDEGTATWNNQPMHNDDIAVIIPTNNSYDSIVVDITHLLDTCIRNSLPFHGIYLELVTPSPYRSMTFSSSDATDPLRRPKFIAIYGDNPASTCSDGIQNGDETGIDCGGSCTPCGSGGGGNAGDGDDDWAFLSGDSLTDPIYHLGNVAIGTEDPGTYRLAVDGAIKTREVKVTQTDWADYVFEPDYPLMPLEQLRSYIDSHGHLPGIPTEEAVKTNGVYLGTINKKLLEKIEELTLYILAQDRRIQMLEQRQ